MLILTSLQIKKMQSIQGLTAVPVRFQRRLFAFQARRGAWGGPNEKPFG
jgi:hypothetical protein